MRGPPLAVRDEIARLVGKGARFSDVAAELGLTKGQVAGVVYRLRGAQPTRRRAPRARKKPPAQTAPSPDAGAHSGGRASRPSIPSTVPSPPASSGPSRRETVRARVFDSIPPARTCQWIDGEPSDDDACKCGAPSVQGFSYCPAHLARAYQPRKAQDGTQAPSIEEWNRRRKLELDALVGAG